MKTIEEIKKFFPNHKFKDDYDLILIQFTAEDLIYFSEEYAKKVSIASLEKASEKAKIKYTLDEELNKHYLIDKSSITNVENIVL